MVCGEGGRSLTNGTPEACGLCTARGEHKTYDLIRALREAGCARGACALLPKDVRICDAWHLYSAGEEYSSHCVGEKKKKVGLCAQIEKVLWSGRLAAGGTRLPFSRTTLRPTPSSSNLHGAPPEVEQAPHAGTGRSPRSASRDS